MNYKKRKGITLIETLFVLGIMAILLGIIMVVLSQTTEKQKAYSTYEEIGVIKDAMRSLMNAPSDYDSFNTQILTRSGLLPKKYISSDYNSLVSPFGTSATVVSNGGTSYAIYIWGLSKSQCTLLLSTASPDQFSFVQVSQLIQYRGPIPGSEASRVCNIGNKDISLIYVVNQGI